MSDTPDPRLAEALGEIELLSHQLRGLVRVEQRHYRTLNELDRQLENMRTLESFARANSGSDDAGAILARALEVVHAAFTLDWVAAFRVDTTSGRLEVVSADPPLPATEFAALEPPEIVWLRALPELSVHVLPAEPAAGPLAALAAHWWPREIPAPAVHAGRLLVLALRGGADTPTALLVAYSTERRRAMYWPADLSEGNLPFLRLFANHVERALENAALTARLRERTAELTRSLEELERAQSSLVQAQKMEAIGRLAGGIAHDFNNLLTVVLGHSALARDALADDDPRRDHLQRVLTAGQRAEAITRQLLAFGRRQPQVRREVDLNQLATTTAQLLERLIGEHIVLALELHAQPLAAWVDPTQVEQVLLNLVLNARDALPRGGRIRVVTRVATAADAARCEGAVDAAAFAVLEVVDDGTGMDAETRARIFEPFFTTKEPGRGTGLGLAVVHGIVHQGEGHVLVESAPGEGARFTILLPRQARGAAAGGSATAVAPAASVVPGAAGAPAAPAAAAAATILLVEDEAMVRYITRQFLEQAGHVVLEAADGERGLAVFREHRDRIALLLSDVVMPRMGGVELAATVARERPDLPIVLMSGYSGAGEREDAGRALVEGAGPACVVLGKPFRADELIASVRRALAARGPAS